MTRTSRSSRARTRGRSKGSMPQSRARTPSSRPAPTRPSSKRPSKRLSSPALPSELPAPQLANIVFGGMTPEIGQGKLAQMGFGLVLYANATLQAALKASRDVLAALKRDGSLARRRRQTGKLRRAPAHGGEGNLRRARATLRRAAGRLSRQGRPPMRTANKPWDGIISQEEQRAYAAAGFGRRTGLGRPTGPADHRCAVPHGRLDAEALLGGDQGISDGLRRCRMERGRPDRTFARPLPRNATGRFCFPTSHPRRPSIRDGSPTRSRHHDHCAQRL